MRPHVVADIGNTRVKWGLVDPQRPALLAAESLPDDPAAWRRQAEVWRRLLATRGVAGPLAWVVASVHPGRTQRLREWIDGQGDRSLHLHQASQLPLRVNLEHPDKVGIDRLLNAVAVTHTQPPGRGGVLISAGTAVTVDWVDEAGAFQGGAIFPGLDLMAEALHQHTALLPRVTLDLPVPALPAKSTTAAMQVGIFLAVVGGLREAVRRYAAQAAVPPRVYFTGGQAPVLAEAMGLSGPDARPEPPWDDCLLWPYQTLVGALLSAEALP